MNIWKIQPFSGKDTSGDYTLIAFSIRYIGTVSVEPSAEGMFQVDYFTDRKVIREANRDVITVDTVKTQLTNMGLDDAPAQIKAKETIQMAIMHLLGGESKEVRYATLSQIIGSFGMELLPLEVQDGILFAQAEMGVPTVTPMQKIENV